MTTYRFTYIKDFEADTEGDATTYLFADLKTILDTDATQDFDIEEVPPEAQPCDFCGEYTTGHAPGCPLIIPEEELAERLSDEDGFSLPTPR